MSTPGMTDWETTLDLPLRSIGDQIRRAEAQLRDVDVVAAGLDPGSLQGEAEQAVAARLEVIRVAIEGIEGLILDIENQMSPQQRPLPETDDHREYVRRTKSRQVDD